MENKELIMHRGLDQATVYLRQCGARQSHIVAGILVTNPNVDGIVGYQETMLPADNEIRGFWEFHMLLSKAQKVGFVLDTEKPATATVKAAKPRRWRKEVAA